MATDPKETTERKSEHRLGDLGITRIPSEEDPRRKDPELLDAIAKIAPGTGLREAVDDVIRSHEGALIVDGLAEPGARRDLGDCVEELRVLPARVF